MARQLTIDKELGKEVDNYISLFEQEHHFKPNLSDIARMLIREGIRSYSIKAELEGKKIKP